MNHDDEQLSRLYSKLTKAEPSQMVDARIHRAAQKAGNAERKKFFTRWVSVAAVLVLSVGVVLRVVEETPVKQDLHDQIMSSESKQWEQLEEAGKASESEAFEMPTREMPTSEMRTNKMPTNQIPKESQSEPVMLRKKVAPAAAAPNPIPNPIWQEDELPDKDVMKEERVKPDMLGSSNFSTVADAWCGQDDLAGVNERQPWIDRMEQLKQLQKIEQVRCIEQLLNRNLAQ